MSVIHLDLDRAERSGWLRAGKLYRKFAAVKPHPQGLGVGAQSVLEVFARGAVRVGGHLTHIRHGWALGGRHRNWGWPHLGWFVLLGGDHDRHAQRCSSRAPVRVKIAVSNLKRHHRIAVEVGSGGHPQFVGTGGYLSDRQTAPGAHGCGVGNRGFTPRTNRNHALEINFEGLAGAHGHGHQGLVDARAFHPGTGNGHHGVPLKLVSIPHAIHDETTLLGHRDDKPVSLYLYVFSRGEQLEFVPVTIGVDVVIEHRNPHDPALGRIHFFLRDNIVPWLRRAQWRIRCDMHGEARIAFAAAAVSDPVADRDRGLLRRGFEANESLGRRHMFGVNPNHIELLGKDCDRIAIGVAVIGQHIHTDRPRGTHPHAVFHRHRWLVHGGGWRYPHPHSRDGLLTEAVFDDVGETIGAGSSLIGRVIEPARTHRHAAHRRHLLHPDQ